MSKPLHYYYDQLTLKERTFVDEMFRKIYAFRKKQVIESREPPFLAGDDRAEYAVNAVSLWVIQSRIL